MRSRTLLTAAIFLVLLPAALHAQIAEAYATLTIDPLSSVRTGYSATQLSNYTPIGGTFGGTLNFINFAPIAVGIDGSETFASSATHIWLAGIKITAKPPAIRIKPYFKLSVGRANLHVPQNYSSTLPPTVPTDYYIYNAALGVDYPLTPHVDLRIVEIGDGRTLGGGSTNPTNLLTINSGLVVHF